MEDPNFYHDSFLFVMPANYERPDDESTIARFIMESYGNLGTLSQIASETQFCRNHDFTGSGNLLAWLVYDKVQ